MNWAFWTGTTIFLATVSGMLWLRNRSVNRNRSTDDRDAQNRVLVELLRDQRAGYRRSAAALRRRLGMTVSDFYLVTERLIRSGLVRVVEVKVFSNDLIRLNGYQLTNDGIDVAQRPFA